MAKEIDEEIRRIIEDAFTRAEQLLQENIDKLHLVAGALLELETLDAAQFEKLFTGEVTAEELIADTREQEKATEEINAREAEEHLRELERAQAVTDEEAEEGEPPAGD
jgi:cell division protease FtsH